MRRDALLAALFAAVFVALTVALAAGGPLIELDLAVREWAEAHRVPAVATAARLLNRLGQGGVLLGICLVLAVWLGRHRRRTAGDDPGSARSLRWWTWQPTLYVFTAALLVIPPVLVIKALTERGAPSSPLPPEQTVPLMGTLPPAEYDSGYPSGHALNMIVWYGMLTVLVSCLLRESGRPDRWWSVVTPVLLIVPALIVFAAQTYLSFHWLTDSLAGFALGLAVDRVLSLVRRLA